MPFVFIDRSERIAKAKKTNRPKWKATRTPRRLASLHNHMEKAISVDLVTGIKRFRTQIPDKQVIYEAWKSGGYPKIMETIPWDNMHAELKPARDKLFETMTASAGLAFSVLDHPQKDVYRFDYKNPRIERVWRERTGEWMVDPIIDGGKEAIQGIVHRQFTEGLSPEDLAGEIRNYVGLYPRLANAHTNYVNKLSEDGLPQDRIDLLSEQYYNRLLDYRATSIARTETNFMINRGQLEVWKQGKNDGIIPKSARKVWVADALACDEICAPMDGEDVGIDESWVLPNGDVADIPTESHPNCNCIMTIEYGDEDGDEDSAPDEDQPEGEEE